MLRMQLHRGCGFASVFNNFQLLLTRPLKLHCLPESLGFFYNRNEA